MTMIRAELTSLAVVNRTGEHSLLPHLFGRRGRSRCPAAGMLSGEICEDSAGGVLWYSPALISTTDSVPPD
jgi:hypothetical protein